MLGWLLYLVYDLDLAFLVLGEDGGVVGADELLAVEFLELLEVSLCFLDALVFACVEDLEVDDEMQERPQTQWS
jgi:hypothetical protein